MAFTSLFSLSPVSAKAVVKGSSATPQAGYTQNLNSAVANVGQIVGAQPDVQTLIQDLRESIKESRAYDSIRIVAQLNKLGAQASPAAPILIELLGKQLPDCQEELRLCPDKTLNCPRERRVCAEGAEMKNYDYLTPYAFAALKQIGAPALPNLSVVLKDETFLKDQTFNEESYQRRRLAAGVMGSIGPAAIPFLADILRASDHSQKRVLALGALNSVLSVDPTSGNQLADLVPYITSFFGGDFDTTDQAINVLGAIGPAAAAAVPRLVSLLSYERVLGFGACPVGERTGYIFRSGAMRALVKIGTPEAMKAVEQFSEGPKNQ